MKSKEQRSLIVTMIGVFIMISIGLFTGCTSNNTDNNQGTYIVLSGTQNKILDSVSFEYTDLLENYSAEDARIEIVNRLNSNYEGIADAELGQDGYTIFIEFSNGRCIAFDTFESLEYEEPNENSEMFSGYIVQNNNQIERSEILFDTYAPVISQKNSYASFSADFESTEVQYKITSGSKKVIMLVPCSYEGVVAHHICEEYFKNHGWTDEDITIKENKEKTSMDMKPEDFFHLYEYGIILIFAHGNARDLTDEKMMWLECCTLDNKTFQENKVYREWLDQNILIIRRHFRKTPENWFNDISIRADVLRENIGNLPSSYVHLATCYGIIFKNVFLSNSAKLVLSWNHIVYSDIADANQVNIVKCMLEKNFDVFSSYNDNDTIRSYEDTGRHGPFTVEFMISPSPNISSAAQSFFFPAWIDTLNVMNIPYNANYLRVTISYGASNTLKFDDIPVNTNPFEITSLSDTLFPSNQTLNIEVQALDASNKELADGQDDFTLSVGANFIQINLTEEQEKQERKYVQFDYNGYNITLDLTISSDKWETGKVITATVKTSCTPIDTAANIGVPGCYIRLQKASGEVLSSSPSLDSGEYGIVQNGYEALASWGYPSSGWGSPVTFTATFRLDTKEKNQPSYIEAGNPWTNAESYVARIYFQ